jgi:predicted SAM-dependent methyltransferase
MRKLHIGGVIRAEGWEIFDINPGPAVDHIGDARDLSRFPDAAFEAIYASHVVEHFDFVRELPETLAEWHRVIVPGGSLYVSVPDLEALARLFLDKEKLSIHERFHVMCMIFGGHLDKHDYHVVGFDQDILAKYLLDTGFVRLRRVNRFGFFADSSEMQYKGVPISVNLIADKPA